MPRLPLILATAITLALAAPAFAGEQYVDRTGFAVSGYDVVAYRSLDQAPVGQPQPQAVPGRADITADYNGATFAFASEENRDLFLTDPAFYAPAFDGHCAYGVAVNGKVPANPHLWRIVDDVLYLNITTGVVEDWEADIPGFLAAAYDNWVELEDDGASGRRIPGFSSEAPVAE